jgi:hypothetical protein
MATYNEDGSSTYEPGESNDRAVAAEPPVDPPLEGDADIRRRPTHPTAPSRPTAPGRPTHPIASHPEPR